MEELLGYLQRLAERAADPECSDRERALLQRDFAALRSQFDSQNKLFHNEALSAISEQLARISFLEAGAREQSGAPSSATDYGNRDN